MDAKILREIGAARAASHDGSASQAHYGDKQEKETMGATAESFFATAFGLPFDHRAATKQTRGDGGIDFRIPLKGWAHPFTVDVKGASPPHGLKEKVVNLQRRPPPDAYVGVGIKKNGQMFFTGFLWGREMASQPIDDLGYGKIYLCEWRDLRPMEEFCTLMALRTDLKYIGPK